jgi:hypothetical protein
LDCAQPDCNQGIRHRKLGIIVRVNAKGRLNLRPDVRDDLLNFFRKSSSIRVAQHEAVCAHGLGRKQCLHGILRIGLVSVEEVLRIEEDLFHVFLEKGH